MGTFANCIGYVLQNEGGFAVPPDIDQPTNAGITLDDLSRWLGQPATIDQLKNLTLDAKKEFYTFEYWNPLGLDDVGGDPICTCILDTGVNEGLEFAAESAQTVCNQLGALLEVDGDIGELTKAALNNCSPRAFIQNYYQLVKAHYDQIVADNPSDQKYYTGWMNRANRLLTLVQA